MTFAELAALGVPTDLISALASVDHTRAAQKMSGRRAEECTGSAKTADLKAPGKDRRRLRKEPAISTTKKVLGSSVGGREEARSPSISEGIPTALLCLALSKRVGCVRRMMIYDQTNFGKSSKMGVHK